ncbi:uncharacterized protein TrAtP1_004903 [Trichoderma atroviride]|uniref:uncharacterized protein n=1 Tax=Hypocrea atroviridis TaxID=63577 RepID=UPI0033270418|nr:hypothetical protein TrAtP1_004903 [Trichoderma atroviride]
MHHSPIILLQSYMRLASTSRQPKGVGVDSCSSIGPFRHRHSYILRAMGQLLVPRQSKAPQLHLFHRQLPAQTEWLPVPRANTKTRQDKTRDSARQLTLTY